MAGTYTNLLYHVVFSTKNREPMILPSFEERLHQYIGGIVRGKNGVLLAIGGMPDHIHLAVKLKPGESVSRTIGEIKSMASKWINDHSLLNGHFSWQVGFGAFSVSESVLSDVVRYIESQDEHHRTSSFQEEFLSLLKKHRIPFDPNLIWK